ncbi:MAG: DUF3185 domain-containing protein [Candidatus Eisenbacteria bacterium]|nr:DUF3185 domain-containing protein [Candidatus Eisenbacteria bacterium]
MKASSIVGVLLIIVGIAALALQGFHFTKKEKALDIGDIEVTTEKREHVALPPVLGAIALIGGIVLVAVGSRGRSG